jgi:hypothetical protein
MPQLGPAERYEASLYSQASSFARARFVGREDRQVRTSALVGEPERSLTFLPQDDLRFRPEGEVTLAAAS